jgi:serine/threonine protein kinase/WD40 repeat protein
MLESSNRQKDIFLKALDLVSPAEQAAFLGQACGGDVALRRQIEAMLQAHAERDSFLEKPAAALSPTIDEPTQCTEERAGTERLGTRVGPYKLLQQLGEGGMGVVFLAEQQESVRRMVALKIMKAGMNSAQVVARFEQERQALALMDHPNIAKVFDGGTTASGRPYFVMDLIKGVSITRFCDQQHLTPRERLELFIPVCQAVQHAHQKGVIHRDLKPSNVLIALYDGKPVPKVIDFGVAKATSQKLTERTLFTEVGNMIGTLEYMAPEQAELNNLDIDTRADIYALGVLLYELLTGAPPFSAKQLRSNAFAEMLRIIREVEPPRPSTRLSSSQELPAIAACRKLEPSKLTNQVRGDLDWIVMKCLEKERGRRYETANAVALDVQRYLADEPVQAGPPSAGYRLRKFVKRNRGPVTAAAVVLSAVLLGIAGTTWGWVEALWQRDDAIQARADEVEQRIAAVKAEKAKAKADERARKAAEREILALGKVTAVETARAEEATRKTRLIEAHLALERGMNACERDQVQEGLLWLARSLEAAPKDDRELQLSLRRLLAAWSGEISMLKEIIPLHGYPKAISPNRKLVAEGSMDVRSVRLTDVHTGKLVSDPLRMSGLVYQVVFSPDGKLLATAFYAVSKKAAAGHPVWDVGIRLWEIGSGKPVGELMSWEETANVDHVVRFMRTPLVRFQTAFSPDGTRLVTVLGGYARLWEAHTGKPVGEPIRACRAVFSPDSEELLTVEGNDKKGVDFWDVRTGKRAPRLAEDAVITSLAISPDGKLVACGGLAKGSANPNYFSVIEATTGRTVAFGNPSSAVLDVGFAPTGKFIAVQSNEGIELFPVSLIPPNGEPVSFKGTGWLIPPSGGSWPDIFAFSPDGQKLLTMSNTLQIGLWDARNAAAIGVPVKFSPSSERLWATFDQTGTTMLAPDFHNLQPRLLRWQLPPSPVIRKLDADGLPFDSHMAFNPDGKTIAVIMQGQGGIISFVDRNSGKFVGEEIHLPKPKAARMIAFSPDGKILLALCGEQTGFKGPYSLQLCNVASRQPIGRPLPVATHYYPVPYPFAFRPDGKRLVVADATAAHILDTSTGTAVSKPLKVVGEPSKDEHWISALAFSPDGKFIICGTNEGIVKVWNAETGEEAGPTLPRIGIAVSHFAFSPDGRSLLTWSRQIPGSADSAIHLSDDRDRAIHLWDARTGRRIGGPFPHQDPYALPSVSADWKILLTNTSYNTVRLWDIETGKPRSRNLPIFSEKLMTLSPDGKLALTRVVAGLQFWDVGTGRPVGKPLGIDADAQVNFSPDSRSLLYPGPARLLEITQPLEGDPARLRLWVEVITGRELDAGGEVAELDTKAWQERYDRLQKLGGPPTP